MHVLSQDGSDEHAQDAAGVDGPVEGGEEACDVSRLGGMKLVPAEGTDARLDPSRPNPQEHQSAPHPPGAGGIARQSGKDVPARTQLPMQYTRDKYRMVLNLPSQLSDRIPPKIVKK